MRRIATATVIAVRRIGPYCSANTHDWFHTEDLMISFFRRALASWFALGLLGLVLVAFIITGVGTKGFMPGQMGGGEGGDFVARADDIKVSSTELLRRAQNQFESARRQQPAIDQKAFVAGGGFDSIADALIGAHALEAWGRHQGFAVGKRLIDAQIATIPAFRGVTGQFDENAMRAALAQARVSERDLRGDIAADLLRNQILMPVIAAGSGSAALAKPYATILLEERQGSVGIIPFQAFVDPRQPSEAEVAAAYKANIAAYTRPEARVLRYALFGTAQVAAQAVPTDAEVAQYYQQNAGTYAAKESRSLSQLITPNEAQARSIAAAAKGGTPLSAAAAKAGLEASTLTSQNRADYAGAASEPIAAQVFSAAKGSVVGPIKGAFGWYVVKVEAITGNPARSLEQVRPEIVAALTKQKSQEMLSDLGDKIENAIADGASFNEVAANNKLTVVETPPVLASGQAVDQPGWKTPPELNPLLKAGFEADPDEHPTVETVTKDQQYALLGVTKVIAPTPLPLAQVHDQVAKDIIVKRAAERAQATASQITAAVNRGVPLAKAMTDSGVKLPPPQPARAREIDVAQAKQQGQPVPPPVNALFTLQKGKAKLVPGDKGGVLFVTVLDTVVPGDLTKQPGLLDTARREMAQSIAPELGEEFMRAVEKDAKVQRYPQAIAAARRQFAGGQ
jgi:peptidyl-prolyl cis-trans isomerase D